MKRAASIITLVTAIAFAGSALAGGAATKEDCEANGGTWDAANSACK